jgi:hypothetical protein|tara:strand:+ start:53 stop:262 length:210 start_codon:yes stop_codon:yes gene_type:complete
MAIKDIKGSKHRKILTEGELFMYLRTHFRMSVQDASDYIEKHNELIVRITDPLTFKQKLYLDLSNNYLN